MTRTVIGQDDILKVLESQEFNTWYNGPFEAYICGDDATKTREEIKEVMKADIQRMFFAR